jgi:hypothetical protein
MRVKFIVLLFLAGCGTQPAKENKDITQFRKELSKIDMPLEFNSDRQLKLKSIELSGNEILKGLKEKSYFTLLGKVFETEKNITILGYIPDDTGTPLLITFDNQGSQISSHAIYENAMGDMGIYITNTARILPDRHILFTDSTTTRKINAEGDDEIPGTDSLSVTHKKYRITDEGKIERVE